MTGTTDRRGELIAILGFVLCVLAAGAMAALAIYCYSIVVWALACIIAGGIGIWVLTWIQLHQLRLLAEEQLEVSELEQQRQRKLGGTQTIFDEEELEQMDKFAMGRRLRAIERFLVPPLALGVALLQLAAGIAILPWAWTLPVFEAASAASEVQNVPVAIFVAGGLVFAFFMMSRFAIDLSKLHDWAGLRAGGNYLFGCSMASLLVLIAMVCTKFELFSIEDYSTWILGCVLAVLACESISNFILDFYRPRIPGQVQRPFYESRLLGMFSEPGGILRSFAKDINYQFGFQVSETWFYKLMRGAVLPLIAFQIFAILSLTVFVVVPPGHQAVIERNGKPWPRTAKPGIHLTWPWPIDRATVVPVDRVRRMEIGHEQNKAQYQESGHAILWTKNHYEIEYKLLVADHRATENVKVPVNLLSVSMPVHWRVKPGDDQVIRFHRQSADPSDIIESLAYQSLTQYAAQADILDLLGERGITAAAALKRSLQDACDSLGDDHEGLGVEIVHVGIGGIHPPPDEDVAKAYEEVVNASEKKESMILAAQGDAAQLRVTAAGNKWEEIHDAIVAEDKARKDSAPDADRHAESVEELFRSVAGGTAGKRVKGAEQRAYDRVFKEMAEAERYSVRVAAYKSAPLTYERRIRLRMLEELLDGLRKYIIAVDQPDKVLIEIDTKTRQGLDVLSAGEGVEP